jgi:hypothetical protein
MGITLLQGQQTRVTPEPGSEISHTVVLARNGQPRTLNICRRVVLAQFPSGNRNRLELIAIHDPQNGLFWWHSYGLPRGSHVQATSDFLENNAVYLLPDSIVVFWTTDRPGQLNVQESRKKFSTLDEGYRDAYSSIDEGLNQIDPLTYKRRGIISVDLEKTLSRSFLENRKYQGMAGGVYQPVRILCIANKSGFWTVTVQGPNGDEGVLFLSTQYQLEKVLH